MRKEIEHNYSKLNIK